MRQKISKPIDLQKESLLQQLLIVMVFVVSLLFIRQINSSYNTRNSTDLLFDKSTDSFIITKDNLEDGDLFIGDNWILVPNVNADSINYGAFRYSDYRTRPYIRSVSISPEDGWNDTGDNSSWVNTVDPVAYRLYPEGGETKISAAYLARFILPLGIDTIRLNLSDINGKAEIFCNGVDMGSVGIDDQEPGIDITCGNRGITLTADNNRTIELIIAVKSSSDIYCPGMTVSPSMSTSNADNRMIFTSLLWIIIEILAILLSFIAGFVLIRSSSGRRQFLSFLAIQIIFLLFTMIDTGFLSVDSIARVTIRFYLMVVLGFLSYLFVSSLFLKSNLNKISKFWNLDWSIPLAVGIILLAYGAIRKTAFENSALVYYSLVYTLLIAAVCIFKVLFLYINENNGVVGLCASVTAFFCFIGMQPGNMAIYNIPVYSQYFIAALVSLEIMLVAQYIRRYKYLQEMSKHLRYLVKEKTEHISEINRDLYNTNKRLMENEEARKNVLSNVSHDLRTPITAIRGYAELLLSSGTNMKPEQRQTYLNNILKRSHQMEQIVSDIVELTRMESNANEFVFMELSIAELLDELVMMYEADLRDTTKKVELELPDDDALIVKADPRKFTRVIENLVSNAINYTYDEALIKIKAWRSNAEQPISEQRIHITISDNGIGIPEDALPHIFDRFYRAGNSGQNIKGTGLGLSIVKTVIDHHDADITVESTLGVGTTFHIVMKATY